MRTPGQSTEVWPVRQSLAVCLLLTAVHWWSPICSRPTALIRATHSLSQNHSLRRGVLTGRGMARALVSCVHGHLVSLLEHALRTLLRAKLYRLLSDPTNSFHFILSRTKTLFM